MRRVLTSVAMIGLALVVAPVSSVWAVDVDVGLLGDVVVSDEDLRYLNQVRTGDSYTDFLHTRLFVNGSNDRTAFFLQLIMTDSSVMNVRVYGAYLQHQLFEKRELYFQAGKIPTPEGTWGPRNYADENPLVGIPFAYYWQSNLPVDSVPGSLDDLVASGDDRPQSGTKGVLILYENCWHDGLTLLGVQSGISYLFSATRGAPGDPITGGNTNDNIGLHAKLGWSPVPQIEMYASWGRGAYLRREAEGDLPPDKTVNDFDQTLLVGSLKLSGGHFILNGEVFYSEYETPLRAEGLTSYSAYGELDWRFAPGWYIAVRYDTIRYEEVETSSGANQPWDTDVERWEAGIGYHVNRDFMVKAVGQVTHFLNADFGEDTFLPMVQFVARF